MSAEGGVDSRFRGDFARLVENRRQSVRLASLIILPSAANASSSSSSSPFPRVVERPPSEVRPVLYVVPFCGEEDDGEEFCRDRFCGL